jgi:hypothetical protein
MIIIPPNGAERMHCCSPSSCDAAVGPALPQIFL